MRIKPATPSLQAEEIAKSFPKGPHCKLRVCCFDCLCVCVHFVPDIIKGVLSSTVRLVAPVEMELGQSEFLSLGQRPSGDEDRLLLRLCAVNTKLGWGMM